MGRAQNESEVAFEQYLTGRGLTDFVYEPPTGGTSSKPDYRLTYGDSFVYFDVKEFEPVPADLEPGFGAFDPYGPIRWKIRDVWKQFRGLGGSPCGLVLYNSRKPLVYLTPDIVVAAMIGDLGIEMPFNPEAGLLESESRMCFTKRGMMIRYESGRPTEARNLNTSAIIVLEHLPLGNRRFRVDRFRVERERGRKLTSDEFFEMVEQAHGTERDLELTQLRAVVCDNPYALKRLPDEMFRGAFDERYGPADNTIARLFAGEKVIEMEALESRFPDYGLEQYLRDSGEGSID